MGVAAFFILVAGTFLNSQLDLEDKLMKDRVNALVERITSDYKNNLKDVDSDDSPSFLGYSDLQKYCSDRSLDCFDIAGQWSWKITVNDNGVYKYRVIDIYSNKRKDSPIAEIRGDTFWSDYIRYVDGQVGMICTNAFNYYRDKSETIGADINWYAKNGNGCSYDYPDDDSLKEISCSGGWAKPDTIGFSNVIGGVYKYPTGDLEIKNTNDIYGRECKDLTNPPPYAVAIRVPIQPNFNRYFVACCGY
jgi:hypothetical protein